MFKNAVSWKESKMCTTIKNTDTNVDVRLFKLLKSYTKNQNEDLRCKINMNPLPTAEFNKVILERNEEFKGKSITLLQRLGDIFRKESNLSSRIKSSLQADDNSTDALNDLCRDTVYELSMNQWIIQNFCDNLSQLKLTENAAWMASLNNVCNDINTGLELSFHNVKQKIAMLNLEDKFCEYINMMNSRQTNQTGMWVFISIFFDTILKIKNCVM